MTDSRKKLGNLPFPKSGILALTRYKKVVGAFFAPDKIVEFAGKDVLSQGRWTVVTKYGKPVAVFATRFQLLAMELQRAMN